ncbi:Smr/MutS family protein [Stappia stellulata]|uniref:Smr/MutS family protein n=1 Tax=Stappia stellulata TaxID=71235 RepID=UPI000428479A|nr:Smr/MutS family protein [Stappia stellulata]
MTVRRRRARQPSSDERRLWAQVTADVTPLESGRRSKQAATTEDQGETAAPPAPVMGSERPPAPRAVAAMRPKAPPAPPPLTPLAPLEPRQRRKLARGTRAIDARIDLHGLTQAEAHVRLRGFLAQAQAQGCSLVLVITGKGGPGGSLSADGRGVLRRVVPQWLSFAEFRPLVVGFEEAHAGHGGGGALYVRVRKAGRGRT